MLFSRQLRALTKLAVLWAAPWTLAGILLGLYRWMTTAHLPGDPGSLMSWLATHGLAFGTLGLISGLDVGLLLAWAERGRQVEQIKPGRLALWGIIGGLGPPLLFGILGLSFGAPRTVYLPLLGLGFISAAASVALMKSAVGSAGRRPLPTEHPMGKLGAG